jgi:hypothetical protein
MNRTATLQRVARKIEEEFIFRYDNGSSYIYLENEKKMGIEGEFDARTGKIIYLNVYATTNNSELPNITAALINTINTKSILNDIVDDDYEYAPDDDDDYQY